MKATTLSFRVPKAKAKLVHDFIKRHAKNRGIGIGEALVELVIEGIKAIYKH